MEKASNVFANQSQSGVSHNQSSPVFIVGHARSGTSMTVRLLRKYLQIAFGTESQFIVRFYQQLHRYGNLKDDRNLQRLVDDILKERWFQRCYHRLEFQTDSKSILAEVKDRTYRGVLEAVFGQLCQHLGMNRWGDKTPEYLLDLPVLLKLFPDAKFIHVVRDGRDVALSAFQQPFGENNVVMAAKDWRDTMERVNHCASELPAHRFLEIKYEQLLQQPVMVFGKLIEFLEIDDPQGEIIEFIERNVGQDIKQNNYEKWRTNWNRSRIIRFDRIAFRYLRQYEYDVSVDEERPPSRVQLAIWSCHNLICKLSQPGYWKDSFYRLKLKLK